MERAIAVFGVCILSACSRAPEAAVDPDLARETIATTSGREAIGRALTQMLRDHEISHDRAVELARMVLRDNVRKLYGLP